MSLFATAVRHSVADAESYERRVVGIQAEWRTKLGRLRADSTARRLLDALPGVPVFTVATAAALTGRSEQAVNEAVAQLVRADVLKQTTIGRRNRAFEATSLLDAFNDLERQLASPDADTHISRPARAVP